MPYALAYLVLPLVLHEGTRKTMEARIRHFQVWINRNQQIKVGLAVRARSLVPYSREALILLRQAGLVEFRASDAALMIVKPLRRFRRQFQQSQETIDCQGKSSILGKWFARTHSQSTIYASLGLMP
jgi:Family of unknown function (DUF6521)